MEDEDLKDYILLNKSEYDKFVETRTKYEQYKQLILKNINNQKLINAMVIIEKKNYYELVEENRKEGK